MRPKTSLLTWGVAIGLVVGLAGGLAVFGSAGSGRRASGPFQPAETLDTQRALALAKAVLAFERARGRRPERLQELVTSGVLPAGGLFGRTGGAAPAIDPASGRFTVNPDVLYFPALRNAEPPDLVLACTLFRRRQNDRHLVICNDRRVVELSSRKLATALNRTYTYIARQLRRGGATTAPATMRGSCGDAEARAVTASAGGSRRRR